LLRIYFRLISQSLQQHAYLQTFPLMQLKHTENHPSLHK